MHVDAGSRAAAVAFAFALLAGAAALAQQEFALKLSPATNGWALCWQARSELGEGLPTFDVQRSPDLTHWTTIASGLTSTNGLLSLMVSQEGPLAFYRVMSHQRVSFTALGAEEVFGYSRAFNLRLAELGDLSVETFAAMYPVGAAYLDQIGFDVMTADYWSKVDTDPPPIYYDPFLGTSRPLRDFRLNDVEKALLRKNGFVVTGRLGSTTCVDLYYDLFKEDMPVLITTDSILQAWHRSYEAILQDLETTYLSRSLGDMLSGMAAQIPALSQTYGSGPLRQSVLDADYFIAVARSLLAGTQVNSTLGQEAGVAQTLAAIASLKAQPFDLFGRLEKDPNYQYDFSQFTTRGHYNNSVFLERYFRALMWCGRTDLRVAGNPDYASPRELGTAMVLLRALHDSGCFSLWQDMDRVVQVMVGRVDSMTFTQLDALLKAAPVQSLDDVRSLDDLAAVQAAVENGSLGWQDILSDLYFSPLSLAQVKIPRSFTVLGQRFTLDSWALSQVVFDRIIWDADGVPSFNDKIMRRIPSCLDVAFSVLANNQVMPELLGRITNPNGRRFRDGLPYQHNLAAVRQVIDSQTDAAWSDNLYNGWLRALREVSPPPTAPAFPQCMQTRAWAMKTLNTQLASWTHLRHDTIVYVKQSYTPPILCSYPAGYVEPVPAFWQRLNLLATRTAQLLQAIPMTGQVLSPDRYGVGVIFTNDLATIKTNQLAFLDRFAQRMTTLATMAAKEIDQQPFTPDEIDFLKDVVERHQDYWGVITYSGWYPRLYYRDTEGFDTQSDALATSLGREKLPRDAGKWDAIVADVHTDAPSPIVGDPGMVLHEGVGYVNCLIAAIECGPDRAIYLGPVLTHYEFEEPAETRLSDQEWQSRLSTGQIPSPPEWTRSYLSP